VFLLSSDFFDDSADFGPGFDFDLGPIFFLAGLVSDSPIFVFFSSDFPRSGDFDFLSLL
jgi:hypothetical protein